jgi:WD40 repeat protein
VIRVWNLDTGEVRVLDPGDGKWIMDVRFAPDGRLVSSGLGGVRLWNLEDGTSQILQEGEGKHVRCFLSPEGRYLLCGAADLRAMTTELYLHDLKDGSRRPTLASHGGRVSSWAFDHTGKTVVTGSFDGVVRVGPVTGEAPHVLLGHEGMIWAVAVSPDGRWIASGGQDHTVRLWPMPEGQPFHTLPREEFLDRLRALTNLRVIKDESSPTGYRIDVAAFPGWETVPVW